MTEASKLCTSCGMCCDGTLFERAKVGEGEDLAPQGFEVFANEDKRWFRQPCPQFDGVCTVYDDRPAVCRRFRCRVLKDLEAGRIDHAEALGVVASARNGVERIRVAMEAVVGAEPARSLSGLFTLFEERTIQHGDAASRRRFGPTVIEYVQLTTALGKQFKIKDPEQKSLE